MQFPCMNIVMLVKGPFNSIGSDIDLVPDRQQAII